MPIEVRDMGLLVDRGVGGMGVWLSSIGAVGPTVRVISNIAETASRVSAVLQGANAAIAVPFVAGANLLVPTAWWFNGAVVDGNVDVGLYDVDLNRLSSTGAVAQANTGVPQSAALAPAARLLAGRPYYLAISASSATAQFTAMDAGTLTIARATGCVAMASAHPLPNTIVPAVMNVRQIPWFGLTYRTAGI